MEKYSIELNEELLQKTIKTMMCCEPMNCPKAIKVTNEFLSYLECAHSHDGALLFGPHNCQIFMGIPVFLDNAIEHPYYEFVY